MKWKKDNNFKSLNDPNVKLEANGTSHIHNHRSHAMSTTDASWSSIPSVKKEHNRSHAHPYSINENIE
jgi:hypothetical protein